MTMCIVESCDQTVLNKRRSLCGRHYHRERAHGDPRVTLKTPSDTPLSERVLRVDKWNRRDKGSETLCLEWAGRRDENGYGVLKFKNKTLRTHRIMYEIFKGEIPSGKVIMHLCDNPPCANPKHLQAGTQKENNQDAARKGRSRARRKLTDTQVHDIRLRWRRGETQQQLEAEYGVSGGTVSRIMTGKLYRGVPDLSKDTPVNMTARVKTISQNKQEELRACVDEGLSFEEIGKRIGVAHSTVVKYHPGYRDRDSYLEGMTRNGESEKCNICGRTSLVQNLKRHQNSLSCQRAALAKSTRVAV